MQDLFETPEVLPNEVQDIIMCHAIDFPETYEACHALQLELESVGYTCDYGLDGVPFGLRKMQKT
jgi:hypothetical protein